MTDPQREQYLAWLAQKLLRGYRVHCSEKSIYLLQGLGESGADELAIALDEFLEEAGVL